MLKVSSFSFSFLSYSETCPLFGNLSFLSFTLPKSTHELRTIFVIIHHNYHFFFLPESNAIPNFSIYDSLKLQTPEIRKELIVDIERVKLSPILLTAM